MKVPKQLSKSDFPNKPYVNGSIPPTMDNFNALLESYNNLSEVVRELAAMHLNLRLDR